MAIPSQFDIMLPLLRVFANGHEMETSGIYDLLVDDFQLSDKERHERLASGHSRFQNRVAWGIVGLQRAGLIHRVRRGCYVVTESGLNVLASPPERITHGFLMQFPGFAEHRRGKNAASSGQDEEQSSTPEERLDAAYQELHETLAEDLLELIHTAPPQFFERLVIDLLVAMGYGGSHHDAAQAVGRSGDGGIDGIIKEDRLGLDNIYVQAKRWEATVGRPIVQAFAGSLEGARATKGVMLTTSTFSADAREYVRMIQKRIVLIDGPTLANLMIEHGIGVTGGKQYVLKKIDGDYFEPETI